MTAYEVVCPTVPRDRWLEARRTGIGASESPILILGKHYGRTPLDLYMEKVGTAEERDDAERMEWGRALETEIGTKLIVQRCLRPWSAPLKGPIEDVGTPSLLRSTRWPFLLCTPDFLMGRRAPWGWQKVVTEFKTSGRPWDDGLPRAVWIQVQHQLAVTGLQRGYVGALLGGFEGFHFESHEVVRDDVFIVEELVPACEAFWRCVTDQTPPVAGVGDSKALTRLYPSSEVVEEMIHVEGGWLEEDEALVDLERHAREIKQSVEEIRGRIKSAIGQARGIVLPNGVQYVRASGKAFRLIRKEPK